MNQTRTAGNPVMLFMDLVKVRLSLMVLGTTGVGHVVAAVGPVDWPRLLTTLAGTALAAFGANTLNQCVEAPRDAVMERTRNRPVPSGRLGRGQAGVLGLALALAGVLLLWGTVNAMTAGLALLTVVLYVGIYTPLKRLTSLNTLVGATCGALPPMLGWTSVTGSLEAGAWILGLLLFLWQVPHFLVLAWIHREDYFRAGFRMLPAFDPTGRVTFNTVMLYSLALLPLGPLATLLGMAGWTFAAASVVLGLAVQVLCLHNMGARTRSSARSVYVAGLIYLPLVLALMVADRGPVHGSRGILGPVEATTAGEVPVESRT